MSLFDQPMKLGPLAKDVTDRPKANQWDKFPVGQRVRIISSMVDWQFFRGDETGTVVRNGRRYLSIIVKYDQERWEHRAAGDHDLQTCPDDHFYIRREHGFNPDDLLPITDRLSFSKSGGSGGEAR